jgi:hypothetical protein
MTDVLFGWIIFLYVVGFNIEDQLIRMVYALAGRPPEHWPHFFTSLTWPLWSLVDIFQVVA